MLCFASSGVMSGVQRVQRMQRCREGAEPERVERARARSWRECLRDLLSDLEELLGFEKKEKKGLGWP